MRSDEGGDGAVRWQGRAVNHGNCLLTAADDKLIVFGGRRLILVVADPELQQYTELSRVDQVVSDSCYPAPALADGILVIKDRSGTMAAYDLRAR